MTPEFNPMDPALEQAMSEIRDEVRRPRGDRSRRRPCVGEPGGRGEQPAACPEHIRGCADFQALIPDYRAGRLPEARGLAVEGPSAPVRGLPPRIRRPSSGHARARPPAPAAASRYASLGRGRRRGRGRRGVSVWFAVDRYGSHTGRAIVQAVNGTLYEVSRRRHPAAGCRPGLPDGVEIRTAKDSDAMLQLARRLAWWKCASAPSFSTTQSGQRYDRPPGPRQHHRAGRQAPLGPPVCGHRRLPRGRHRDGVQRHCRRQGFAGFGDAGRSARHAGQPGEGAPRPATRP